MNKLEFVNEVGALANKFAFLLQNYTASHDGYDGVTEDKKPIVIGDVSVSIQDNELSTITVGIGSVDSKRRIKLYRYPITDNNADWRIEDK